MCVVPTRGVHRALMTEDDGYEPSPEDPAPPYGDQVRVLCRCGAVAARIGAPDLYAGRGTVAPPLRCRRGHAPRPGLARLRELYAARRPGAPIRL